MRDKRDQRMPERTKDEKGNPMIKAKKYYYLPAEIAARFQYSSSFIYWMVRKGKIKASRIDRSVRIPRSEICNHFCHGTDDECTDKCRYKPENKARPDTAELLTTKLDPPTGYVYMIESHHLYKIGMAKDLIRRLKGMSTMLPDGFTLAGFWRSDSPSLKESELHNEFAAQRVKGEWFKFTPEVLMKIKQKPEFVNIDLEISEFLSRIKTRTIK